MANHPYRSAAHRKLADEAGYFVREGTQQTGTENLIGRWYVGRNGEPFSATGRSYPSRAQAWFAAANAVRAENSSASSDETE